MQVVDGCYLECVEAAKKRLGASVQSIVSAPANARERGDEILRTGSDREVKERALPLYVNPDVQQ